MGSRHIAVLLAVFMPILGCKSMPGQGQDRLEAVTNVELRDAMTACSVGMSTEESVALKAEIERRGADLEYKDANSLVTGILKDSRAEDRTKLIEQYMTCLDRRLGTPAEKKKWAEPTLTITAFSPADPSRVRFRITNHADVVLPIEDIWVQLITCGRIDFAMSNDDRIAEQRIDLGELTFDSTAVHVANDATYSIAAHRTAFFTLGIDVDAISQARRREEVVPCQARASRDFFAEQRRPGEIYLLIRFVRPDNGADFVVRHRLF